MSEPQSTPPSPALDDHAREYLSSHDLSCPRCGYNLRGLTRSACPECGLELRLITDGTGEGMTDEARMVRWLSTHDLVCKKCKTNMRGHTSNVCPGCGRSYMLQHTTGVHTDAAAMPAGSGRRPAGWKGKLTIILLLLPLLVFIVLPILAWPLITTWDLVVSVIRRLLGW